MLITVTYGSKTWEYYMDDKLYREIRRKVIPRLKKKDEDYVLVVDGEEGAGKSTFAMQVAKAIDPSFDLSKVCFTPDEFHSTIISATKGQVVVFDEAFRGLSSRGTLSAVNKMLVEMMMEIRQKNLCILIVLPTYFLLEKYVALWRAKGLFHVFRSHGRRGYWRYYNRKQKKILYLRGKKDYGYGYVKSGFKGRFYAYYTIDEEKYREKKKQALVTGNVKRVKEETYLDQRNKLFYLLSMAGWSQKKIAFECQQVGVKMSQSQLSMILSKFQL